MKRIKLEFHNDLQGEEEVQFLRDQNHILEEKIKFFDLEFQIKQNGLEKRIFNMNQSCSQLISQKTTLQLQFKSLMNYSQQQANHIGQLEVDNDQLHFDNKNMVDRIQKLDIQYSEKCQQAQEGTNRTYKRKQKLKDVTQELEELKSQNYLQQQDFDQLLLQKDRQNLENIEIISELQIKLQDIQLNYSSMMINFQDQIYDGRYEQQENENNQLKNDIHLLIQMNEQLKTTIEEMHMNLTDIDQELTQFIEWVQSKPTESCRIAFMVPKISQMAIQYIKLNKKLQKAKEKKQIQKMQLRSIEMNQLQFQQRDNQDFKNYFKIKDLSIQSPVTKLSTFSSTQDDRKSLFEVKFYQLKSLVVMLSQYFEEFLNHRCSLKELNIQLSELCSESRGSACSNGHSNLKKFRKCVLVIIAITRLKLQVNCPKQFEIRRLKTESPSLNNFQQFIDIVNIQQQVIKALEEQFHTNQIQINDLEEELMKTTKTNNHSNSHFISQNQLELNCYKNLMAQNYLEIQNKSYQINVLEEQVSKLKSRCASSI